MDTVLALTLTPAYPGVAEITLATALANAPVAVAACAFASVLVVPPEMEKLTETAPSAAVRRAVDARARWRRPLVQVKENSTLPVAFSTTSMSVTEHAAQPPTVLTPVVSEELMMDTAAGVSLFVAGSTAVIGSDV
jgi:hypothetical protein